MFIIILCCFNDLHVVRFSCCFQVFVAKNHLLRFQVHIVLFSLISLSLSYIRSSSEPFLFDRFFEFGTGIDFLDFCVCVCVQTVLSSPLLCPGCIGHGDFFGFAYACKLFYRSILFNLNARTMFVILISLSHTNSLFYFYSLHPLCLLDQIS